MSFLDSGEGAGDARARTRIKFCGMTRIEDVRLACALGVDAIGVVFVPRSARCIDLDRARALHDVIDGRARVVALVMDAPADAVAAIVDRLRPDFLQFHGNEDDAFCAAFGCPFIKAVGLRGIGVDDVPVQLARYPSATGFVLDGHAQGALGGSGERGDWHALGTAQMHRPWLLAGGLDAGNVATAIALTRPQGVDVASGIERAPGIKNADKMRAFVEAVRAADSSLSSSLLPQGESG